MTAGIAKPPGKLECHARSSSIVLDMAGKFIEFCGVASSLAIWENIFDIFSISACACSTKVFWLVSRNSDCVGN